MTAALAMVVSAVAFAQILSPDGMLAAAMRAEFLQLQRSSSGMIRASAARPWTWNDVLKARDAAMSALPEIQRHGALARVLQSLLDLNDGTVDPGQAVRHAEQAEAVDADNLIARLARAVVVVMAAEKASPQPTPAKSAEERFRICLAIIEHPPLARRASLYNAEMTQTWRRVLQRFIGRPDVAVSLAAGVQHYRIENHYEALPIIQERLAALGKELRLAGRQEDAERCIRWIAESTLGLIDADPDAGTRLLCANLLARSLDATSPIAEGLRRLIADYHAAAAAAPIDICDQAFLPSPAVSPTAYRRAFGSLVAAGGLALTSLGGATLFFVCCAASVCLWIVRRRRQTIGEQRIPPLYTALLAALLPAMLVSALVVAYISIYGIYASMWLLLVAACVVAFAVLLAAAIAGGAGTASNQAAAGRRVFAALFAVITALLIAVPPPWLTRLCRPVDLTVGLVWVAAVIVVVAVLVAVVISSRRLRALAAAASLVWCVNISAAFVVLQLHHRFDERYQRAVVAGRLDEIPARLGPGWREHYLKPALDAYHIPQP